MRAFPPLGEWHMHCHVLSHMGNGMMGSLLIVNRRRISSASFAAPGGYTYRYVGWQYATDEWWNDTDDSYGKKCRPWAFALKWRTMSVETAIHNQSRVVNWIGTVSAAHRF